MIFINMDMDKLDVIETLLNTNSVKSIAGKFDNGEYIIDRFEVDKTELPEDIKRKVHISGWKTIEDLLIVTMYLNTDLEYISCDDLAFDYNIDSAWWEHAIIPKNIYKYMGVTKNDIEVKPHVIIKSKDGKYTYCDTDISPMM
jgi:hypothetical protein